MTEAVTITNELAILCDIVAGWSVKQAANLGVHKRQALDRLIAHGYVAPAEPLFPCNISTHGQDGGAFRATLRRNKRAKRAGFVQTSAYMLPCAARAGAGLVFISWLERKLPFDPARLSCLEASPVV